MNYLFVFPLRKQVDYATITLKEDDNLYVMSHNISEGEKQDKRVIYFTENNFNLIDNLKTKYLVVFCCHEEGLYWLRNNNSNLWQHRYDYCFFDLLTKDSFKRHFKDKLNLIKYSYDYEEIQKEKVIGKPTIGFASVGVKLLKDKVECKQYLMEFEQMVENSAIKKYQNLYFSDQKNRCMFEAFIEGDFYRTPIVIQNRKCSMIFPIKGIKKEVKNSTDCHWISFMYEANQNQICSEISKQIEKIIKDINLLDGVYVIEFMLNKDGLYVLEFSPRQASERINHLIEIATGLDLEILAVKIIMGEMSNESLVYHKNSILSMQLLDDKIEFYEGYNLFEELEDKSVYRDKKVSRYFISEG